MVSRLEFSIDSKRSLPYLYSKVTAATQHKHKSPSNIGSVVKCAAAI